MEGNFQKLLTRSHLSRRFSLLSWKLMNAGILILGLSGSGKTTLAKRLSDMSGLPYLEIDPLYWNEGVERGLAEFRNLVESHLTSDPQIIEGHFTKIHDLVLPRVEQIFFLDYSLPRIFWQSFARALRSPHRFRHFMWLLRHGRAQRARLRKVNATHVFRTPSELDRFLAEGRWHTGAPLGSSH